MTVKERLTKANQNYRKNSDLELRLSTADNGQHPYAVMICCSDSRVIPEQIFDESVGGLFVIRVAGNVPDHHQLGSVEYAVGHLGCKHIVVMGHTGCGAISAAIHGEGHGYIKSITDEILKSIGTERDPDRACRMNVIHAVQRLQREFPGTETEGAIYDIRTGEVTWLDLLNP